MSSEEGKKKQQIKIIIMTATITRAHMYIRQGRPLRKLADMSTHVYWACYTNKMNASYEYCRNSLFIARLVMLPAIAVSRFCQAFYNITLYLLVNVLVSLSRSLCVPVTFDINVITGAALRRTIDTFHSCTYISLFSAFCYSLPLNISMTVMLAHKIMSHRSINDWYNL